MNLVMQSHNIVRIVKDKMDNAKFHAMLSLFMKDSTSVEAQFHVGRLPVHVAVEKEASVEEVAALLQAYPAAASVAAKV